MNTVTKHEKSETKTNNEMVYQDTRSPIDTEQYVTYRIANAPIAEHPFPHFYLTNVFPEEFYKKIIENLPDDNFYTSISATGRTKGYDDRYIIDFNKDGFTNLPDTQRVFWQGISSWMLGETFLSTLISKFSPYIEDRLQAFPGEKLIAQESGLLTRDRTGYSIGPHTDAPHKLLTLLFYLPKDTSLKHLGTSVYAPKDPNVRCNGGAHYPFSDFKKIITMDFVPNTLFAFFKNDKSFHGVEIIRDEKVERDLIIYNVNLRSI